VVDNLAADLLPGLKGSEGNSNKDVLGHGAVSLFVLNLLSSVDVDELEVSLDIWVRLFVVLESLGELFLEFGDFGVSLLDDLAGVEHLLLCWI
jgi:hypothetical protein